ncbi:conserved hypothetical protein [Segniliparus rotundus DSM 44985]|uniref:Cardiolipin synthase N-terminal domain-containing protein n=1 Tax=Segniliparus rotundus (strain ATCC BAA-972 / CDC 1076 / CIP 108378 / DSM 44985 / JCM 13578) TaxID=640132 RepID=D6ZCA7_SEGRD|nr:PLD nuclease N-terminal domain-containing protein [Segniliparus rotundus]ADG99076.1 conserved hypothetical protein [Segniliparus rotundus DSM 44985]
MPYGLFSLLLLGLLIFCLADAITRDDSQVRHLPKLLWIFLIVLMPLVGSVLWLAIGRPPLRPRATHCAEDERPGRFAPSDPAEEEEFLRRCRERAEQQRRIGKEILRAQRAEQQRAASKPGEPDSPQPDDDGSSTRP